jgi:hypothetical protein
LECYRAHASRPSRRWHLTDLVVIVGGDLDEALRLTGMDGELGGERLRRHAAADGHRRHLDELGSGIAHHLDTEQPLVRGVEHQLEIPVVLAGGAGRLQRIDAGGPAAMMTKS